MQPLVSIIVPCYNQAQYLDDCLQSVMKQTYADWECIILNDGSSDNSQEVAHKWIEKDSRFLYIEKENSGVSDTRNCGMREAKGEYILPLDADDMIEKEYLADAVSAFLADPQIKVVYSNTQLFGMVNRRVPPRPFSYKEMYIENHIPNSAFFRRTDALAVGGYNVNMAEGLEDWDFWLSLLDKKDKVVKLDNYYYLYRIKAVSRSTLIDQEKNERLLLQIFKNNEDKYLALFNPIRDRIEADYYKRATQNIQHSLPFRIGKVVSLPVELFRKAINKIFR